MDVSGTLKIWYQSNLLLFTTLLLQLQLFYAPLDFVWDYPGEPVSENYNQEGKTNLDLLEQKIVSGSGISWAICKSPPRIRQITTPASHHSFFTGQMPFLPPNQQRQSIEGTALLLFTHTYISPTVPVSFIAGTCSATFAYSLW